MYLIAGLGNPDKKYEATRHNIGFETIDLLAHKTGIKLNKLKHKAVFGDGIIAGEKVIVAKPQTYMNLSGESIRDIVNFYKNLSLTAAAVGGTAPIGRITGLIIAHHLHHIHLLHTLHTDTLLHQIDHLLHRVGGGTAIVIAAV